MTVKMVLGDGLAKVLEGLGKSQISIYMQPGSDSDIRDHAYRDHPRDRRSITSTITGISHLCWAPGFFYVSSSPSLL